VSKPTPEEARDWLKESGETPDLSVTWRVSDAPGSAERHLALLKMLFEPAEPAQGGIMPPNG
jgi:hypothetical protein